MIVQAVQQAVRQADAVVILHGTDTLEVTGEALHRTLADPAVAVVLTGAMRPYEFRNTDAAQNVTEALLACRHRPDLELLIESARMAESIVGHQLPGKLMRGGTLAHVRAQARKV